MAIATESARSLKGCEFYEDVRPLTRASNGLVAGFPATGPELASSPYSLSKEKQVEPEQKTTDYQAVLADLEAKRNELDNAIAVIKIVMPAQRIAYFGNRGFHVEKLERARYAPKKRLYSNSNRVGLAVQFKSPLSVVAYKLNRRSHDETGSLGHWEYIPIRLLSDDC